MTTPQSLDQHSLIEYDTTSAVVEHDEGGKMENAWHQLTSYIVQLEKKVKEMEEKPQPVMIGRSLSYYYTGHNNYSDNCRSE